MAELGWALPQLLFALRAGHTANRGRVARLLESLDDGALTSEPVTTAFRDLLQGEDRDLARRVGGLISRRGLSVYATDLVDALREASLREAAVGWLRRRTFPRPLDDLVALACDEQARSAARVAAAELLKGQALAAQQRARLVEGLAEVELHAPLLTALDVVDEALVQAAIDANRAFGQRLVRARRERRSGSPEPSWWERLFPPKASSLGEWPATLSEQAAFVQGIARLAIKAKSRRWLGALHPYLFSPGLTRELAEAVVELQVEGFAARLRDWDAAWQTPAARGITFDLLGRLGDVASASRIQKYLPAHGKLAGADAQEAILALARLGQRQAIAPFLVGALAGVRREVGQDPGGTIGHGSIWGVAFRAGGALKDERFGKLGLDVLASDREVPQVEAVLGEVLAALDPLELKPALEHALRSAGARHAAREVALDVVLRRRDRELIERVAVLAGREPTLTDAATRVLTELLSQEDAPLVLTLLRDANPSDKVMDGLLERALATFSAQAGRDFARELLDQGAGGARAQARALRFLGEGQDELEQLRTCVGLFGSPHAAVCSASLREAMRLDLLGAPDGPRAELREASVWSLLQLVRDALRDAHESGHARHQLTTVLNQLVPRRGREGHLEPGQAEELRGRLRQVGLWHETATFHHMHRELLELGASALDVGLLHGAVLLLMAEREFRHPVSGVRGRYPGPLPRFEQTFDLSSPYVQEALFEVVRGPAYLRTTGLTVRFFGSPRARVRRDALGLLDREAGLVHAEAVLARLGDDDPGVRRAAVELLRRHELGRFAADLRPLLDDAHEGVRLHVARTLADWGDQSCLERLVTFLASDDVKFRREAVGYLRRFEPAQLVGLLAPCVTLQAPRTTAAALAALRPERLPLDEPLADAIFAVAAKGRGPLRARALRFLPALVGARRLGDCVPLLADADARVRQAAGHVLRRRDGRRHAAAIASLAAATEDTQLRLEALALLGDLGVAEAARGLVPLLADEDFRVRAATRRALGASRGFSLQPELEEALKEGLAVGAAPVALAELVAYLDQVGDGSVFETIQQALLCEERVVWEAVVAAARGRDREDHVPRLSELLAGSPALPAPLASLALAEIARCGHRDAQEAVARLVRDTDTETVRRRALATASALEGESGEGAAALATEVARAAVSRLKALEKEAKSGQDRRRAIWQTRGTLTACAAAAIDAGVQARTLTKPVKALPGEAWRAQAPWNLRAGTAELLLQDAGFDPGSPLSVLPKVSREVSRVQAVRSLRDRLGPRDYLRHLVAHVPAASRDAREVTVTELRADRPLRLDDLRGRMKALTDRAQRESYEDLLVSIAENWRSETRELVGEMVAGAVAWVKTLPEGRWSRREHSAQAQAARYARIMLRLDRVEAVDGLIVLAQSEAELLHRILAALGQVEPLEARFAELAGESTLLARAGLLRLLGEAGGSRAVQALADRVSDERPAIRAAAADGLALSGEPSAASYLKPLLEDDDAGARAAALRAVSRLRAGQHEGAVIAGLGHVDRSVALAACQAARDLKLLDAGPGLVRALTVDPKAVGGSGFVVTQVWGDVGGIVRALQQETGLDAAFLAEAVRDGRLIPTSTSAEAQRAQQRVSREGARARVAKKGQLKQLLDLVPRAAAEALVELGTPAEVTGAIAALRETRDDRVADLLGTYLIRALPVERLDEVGVLLGSEHQRVQLTALRVLSQRQHLPALEAVRSLLEHDASQLRRAACQAAAALGSAQLLPDLEKRVGAPKAATKKKKKKKSKQQADGSDRDPEVETSAEVQGAALAAIASLSGGSDPVRARLVAALASDMPFELRLSAVGVLEGLPEQEGSSRALLEVIRGELRPDLTLPEPGEPLELLRERLRAAGSPRRLRGSGATLVASCLGALATLDAGEALARGFEVVWHGLTGPGWPDSSLFVVFSAWARRRPVEAVAPRLLALVADDRDYSLVQSARALLAELAPLQALPLFDAEVRGGDTWSGDEAAQVTLVRGATAALLAGREEVRAILREGLLSPSEAVRRQARAALEPKRRLGLTGKTESP